MSSSLVANLQTLGPSHGSLPTADNCHDVVFLWSHNSAWNTTGKTWTTERRKLSCRFGMEWLGAPHIEQEGKDAAMEMQNPQSRMCAGNTAIDGRASIRPA